MNRKFHIHIDEKEMERLFSNMKEGTPFIEIDGSQIQDIGFDCLPLNDFEKPHGFPKCCPYHRGMHQKATKWFDKFPMCCDNHKLLLNKQWFKKADYNDRSTKILYCLSYTEHFISQKINEDNWYKEITDYIEYVFHSFGTPAIGAHLFDIGIEHYIRTCKPVDYELPEYKRKRLLEFFEAQGDVKKRKNTDFNLLYSIFQKWLKSFPELKYFEQLKNKLLGKIPINLIIYEPEFNPYLGLSKAKTRTKTEFIELLVNSTKKLLSSIDTTKLLQDNVISENERYSIELLNEEHKLRQRELTEEYSKKETKYLKIIKKWLKNEKQFFEQLKPLLQKIDKMPKTYKIEKREAFDTEYLKVFIRDKSKLQNVAQFLGTLQSVRKANVTKNNEIDVTVYPAKTYSADETQLEIDVALDSFLDKGILDPIFNNDKIELSNDGYNSILSHIYNYGQNLEKYKNLYDKFDEEGFRDFFLPHLNTISNSHTATGETFNKIGKTDILIQNQEGINVFIAECKLWKGEAELLKAISQLLERYVTWRDEKVAIIVFNKDMQKFTELIEKASEKMKEHPLFESYLGKTRETSFKYIFKHPEDEKRKINLELIIFNCK